MTPKAKGLMADAQKNIARRLAALLFPATIFFMPALSAPAQAQSAAEANSSAAPTPARASAPQEFGSALAD